VRIKALSLTQPWANWIAEGRKTIETRMWGTTYRGPLLICATRQRVPDCDGPYGAAVCVAELVDCRPMGPADETPAMCEWESGRRAWVLANVRPIAPARIRGRQRLFDVILPGDVYFDLLRILGMPPVPPVPSVVDPEQGGGS